MDEQQDVNRFRYRRNDGVHLSQNATCIRDNTYLRVHTLLFFLFSHVFLG